MKTASPIRGAVVKATLLALLTLALANAAAQDYDRYRDATAVRRGDPAYAVLEEAALSAGLARPYLEGPINVGQLWRAADAVVAADPGEGSELIAALSRLFPARQGPLDYAVGLKISLGYDGAPDAAMLTAQKPYFIDQQAMSAAMAQPALADIRLIFRNGPLAIDLNPEIRPASHVYWEERGMTTNLAALYRPLEADPNMPYRGLASLELGDFSLSFGRDQAQLGPGRRSSLALGYNLPWADHAAAKASFGPALVSWYIVRLDPRISADEEQYILEVRDDPSKQLEDNANYNGRQGAEKAKHLVASRLSWRLAPWLVGAMTQYHLVGGRGLQLSDANPFIIFHNLFQEGVYSVPATLEFSATPVRGIELYGQYLLYDATVADERDDTGNAGASAYQLGLTLLSTPWFDAGPGRLRLDAEFNRADPWAYGKYISWRQFTSRHIFIESGSGRYWVDYPIGFHLGPDAWELWGRLSYGRPGSWDLKLDASYSERGSVGFSWGPDGDYAKKEDFKPDGWVLVKDGQAPERTTRVALSAELSPGNGEAPGRGGLSCSLAAGLTIAEGFGFVPGAKRVWIDAGFSVGWAF